MLLKQQLTSNTIKMKNKNNFEKFHFTYFLFDFLFEGFLVKICSACVRIQLMYNVNNCKTDVGTPVLPNCVNCQGWKLSTLLSVQLFSSVFIFRFSSKTEICAWNIDRCSDFLVRTQIFIFDENRKMNTDEKICK